MTKLEDAENSHFLFIFFVHCFAVLTDGSQYIASLIHTTLTLTKWQYRQYTKFIKLGADTLP